MNLELWDICARRHRGNPRSKAAFERLKPDLQGQREKVYRAVLEAGQDGLTCRELAKRWGVGMNQVSGRFSELKRDGRVKVVGERDGCGVWRVI